ncbi:MAG TPA: hypothetical protein VFJ85_08735 [Acidimicrobiales bacterium]|nr:hypothetical protein [Acidimicrobiales bacterium]
MARSRDKRISRYLDDEVAAYAPALRQRLTADGGRVPGSAAELARVTPVTLEDVSEPASLVLRPPVPMGESRRKRRRRRRVLRRYKPVHWMVQAGVPVGSSEEDLERLAGMGAEWLRGSGVRPDDVLLGFLPAGPHLPYWQLVLGARAYGVPAFHVPPVPRPADAARLLPSVLAGRPGDLARLLSADDEEGGTLDGWRSRVRVVLAAGEPLDDGLRSRLHALLPPRVTLVSAWAPPGARAMWWECKGGIDLHTWPDAEVIQIADPLSGTAVPPGADGEVVWTALGWSGTVLVRLRTGVFASLEDEPCPSCKRPGPRLTVTSGEPSFLRVLDRHAGVARWQAELRVVDGIEELLVFLTPRSGTPLPRLLAELDAELAATQYVVLDEGTLDARLARHGDHRVVDTRA